MKRFIVFLCSLLVCIVVMAQKTIRGTVVDAVNGEPLVGVTIQPVWTKDGTVTNIDGQFSLKVAKTPVQIKVSYLGYKEKIVTVTGQDVDIKLQSSAQELSETVITGYSGTIIRSKLTNSISKVSNKSLTTGMFSNPAQALSVPSPV